MKKKIIFVRYLNLLSSSSSKNSGDAAKPRRRFCVLGLQTVEASEPTEVHVVVTTVVVVLPK
jgi:hypothetical protein